MKPALFPVAPSKASAAFIRPVPQPQVSPTFDRPVFDDLSSLRRVAPASELKPRRSF